MVGYVYGMKIKKYQDTFTDTEAGFSTLSWHPQGQFLAAGGEQGELMIWSTLAENKN